MSRKLRESCQPEDYRRTLSTRFGWFGTICTVETAMLLTAVNALTGVDTIDATELIGVCYSNEMSRGEIEIAFRELHSLDALDFYQTVAGEIRGKFTALVDAEEMLGPDAVIALAKVI